MRKRKELKDPTDVIAPDERLSHLARFCSGELKTTITKLQQAPDARRISKFVTIEDTISVPAEKLADHYDIGHRRAALYLSYLKSAGVDISRTGIDDDTLAQWLEENSRAPRPRKNTHIYAADMPVEDVLKSMKFDPEQSQEYARVLARNGFKTFGDIQRLTPADVIELGIPRTVGLKLMGSSITALNVSSWGRE